MRHDKVVQLPSGCVDGAYNIHVDAIQQNDRHVTKCVFVSPLNRQVILHLPVHRETVRHGRSGWHV